MDVQDFHSKQKDFWVHEVFADISKIKMYSLENDNLLLLLIGDTTCSIDVSKYVEQGK